MHSHHHSDLLVALAGQPNSGKSTVFSLLTGLHQKIGNYPGVTVEKKSGHYHVGNQRIEVVDLPGTYSLTSYSQEERVSRDFILLERPEVIVAVLDSSNFRRHLYLVFQLLEMQVPIVICLNMIDIAERRGFQIDVERCERLFGVPVVATNGATGRGIEELKRTVLRVARETDHEHTPWTLDFGEELENAIGRLTEEVSKRKHLVEDFSPRWIAIKLLEGDREARRIVQHHTHDETWEALLGEANGISQTFEEKYGQSTIKAIAKARNARAEEFEKESVLCIAPPKPRLSDRVDSYVCHPFWGLICIAIVVFSTFQLAFFLAEDLSWVPWVRQSEFVLSPPGEPIEYFFNEWLPQTSGRIFAIREGSTLQSLLNDGVYAGIGGVLTFLPLIFIVFVLLAILEQSGFIARVAMVLDRILRIFGLHGQSILPMILGGGIIGGCAIPAILATKNMKEPKERLLTILVIPFMNCGAKIPVYTLLIAAFFTAYKGIVMGLLVFLSWAIALSSAWLLSRTLVKGSATPLVLELPTYLFPRPKLVLLDALRSSFHFVQKAGTIILAVNVLLWALMYFPRTEESPVAISSPEAVESEEDEEISRVGNSYAGRIGKALVPLSRWAGFDWRDNVALLGGFAAKEVIVSSLATLHSIDESSMEDEKQLEESLAKKIRDESDWSPVKAFAMMVFVMVYAPCGATCITIRKETSWKWMFVSMIYSTVFAFMLAISVFQLGSLLF